jgi:nitroimidazol reductase NimA-like FMN-containing flavoprotein (pyridoxamine 5'-phosphate oxidase superfamily)
MASRARKRAPARAVFSTLTATQCRRMLSRARVGRLAFSVGDHVAIEPIGYVYDRDGLIFRTSPGSKTKALAHKPWVALEIDEVEGPFDWRSVVAYGTMYRLEADVGTAAERRAYVAAVRKLRRAIPTVFTDDDPAPFRTVVMRLEIDRLEGRAAELPYG